MRQCTLVALYRQTKPKALVSLIHECYDLIKKTLLSHFSPYEIPQIHATIVGLEGLLGSSIYNLNINKYRDAQTPMDILQLIDFLRTSGVLPFQIQIGGFVDRDYPFTSRGERPYERSFSIQGDKAVIMGWPICGEPSRIRQPTPIQLLQESRLYPDSLDRIRRAALSFGVMHAYHRQPTDRDNDFYLRIGLLDSSAPAGRKAVVAQEIRTYLSTIDPIIVEITAHDIYIVSYESGKDTLPVQSTKIWSLAEVSQKDLVAFFVEEPSSSTRGSLPPRAG